VNELGLVSWIAARGKGIGDDCAILPGGRGNDLVITTDMMLEAVHFGRADPPALVGNRTLARGLSDIAAMGARPRWCLLSLAVPEWATEAWTKSFYEGLLLLAKQHRTHLVGGDLSHARAAAADIVVIGEAPRGAALLRSGARPGDGIYVSGALGAAGARKYAAAQVEPRLALGRWLRGTASACMDITDGLSLDLHRLCLASRVSAAIDRPLPVAPGATFEHALSAGDDYELLFTAPGRIAARHRGLALTRIGTITRGAPGRIELFGKPHSPRGYDHLAAAKTRRKPR